MLGHFSSDVVEVKGFSHLVTELSVDGHGFDLLEGRGTLRVRVAPDSRSPNLKKPEHMWVSLLKKRKNLLLNSGNLLSQTVASLLVEGNPVSYSMS